MIWLEVWNLLWFDVLLKRHSNFVFPSLSSNGVFRTYSYLQHITVLSPCYYLQGLRLTVTFLLLWFKQSRPARGNMISSHVKCEALILPVTLANRLHLFNVLDMQHFRCCRLRLWNLSRHATWGGRGLAVECWARREVSKSAYAN